MSSGQICLINPQIAWLIQEKTGSFLARNDRDLLMEWRHLILAVARRRGSAFRDTSLDVISLRNKLENGPRAFYFHIIQAKKF